MAILRTASIVSGVIRVLPFFGGGYYLCYLVFSAVGLVVVGLPVGVIQYFTVKYKYHIIFHHTVFYCET